MNADEAYAVWAPVDGPWTPWVKPVLFASTSSWLGTAGELPDLGEAAWLDGPAADAGYRDPSKPLPDSDRKTAVVVDLSGPISVAWGVALARRGFRPIPLFNALPGGGPPPAPIPTGEPGALASPGSFQAPPADPFAPGYPILQRDTSALVNVGAIVTAMQNATSALAELRPPADGPPVFLLDAERRYGHGIASPGRFDNRSISLPTDFPSAVFLRARGIERVVLLHAVHGQPQEDLAHTLVGWQEGRIKVLSKGLDDDAPKFIEVARPTWYRSMFQRFLATIGLRRAPLGGFGGTIPLPSSG